MLAFIKRRQFGFGLLLSLILVLVISYFALARIRNANRAADTPAKSKSTVTKTSDSVSVDSDNDGIPDSAELQSYSDRENFRRWFTLIAEAQFYRQSVEWNAEQRDCSGLIRFAWREALRRHDRPWYQKMGPGYEAVAGDVDRYSLENSPLREKLFRTN